MAIRKGHLLTSPHRPPVSPRTREERPPLNHSQGPGLGAVLLLGGGGAQDQEAGHVSGLPLPSMTRNRKMLLFLISLEEAPWDSPKG